MRRSVSPASVILCLPLLLASCGEKKATTDKTEAAGHAAPRATKTDRSGEENLRGDRPGRPGRDTLNQMNAGEQPLESVMPTIKPGRKTKTDLLEAWIKWRGTITDEEWRQIVEFAAKLEAEQSDQLLLGLAMREFESERGYKLFTSTLDGIQAPERRVPFFKGTFNSKDPTVLADLLVHLKDQGRPGEPDVGIGCIVRSDSLKGEGGPAFIQTLVEDPALAARPELLVSLSTRLGEHDGHRRSLEMEVPAHLASLSAEAKDAYMRGYYRTVLTSGEFMTGKTSADFLESSIPPESLVENMPSISSLDVVAYGGQESMNRFQPGTSAVGDAYLKEVFRQWSIKDKAAASRYLGALPTNDPMAVLLDPGKPAR